MQCYCSWRAVVLCRDTDSVPEEGMLAGLGAVIIELPVGVKMRGGGGLWERTGGENSRDSVM